MRLLRNLFMLVLIISLPFRSVSAYGVKVKIDNAYMIPDVPPFILNNTTYVPLRFLSPILDIHDISWNGITKTVTMQNGLNKILLTVNQKYAYINNIYTKLDNSVLLVSDRTFVPIRFIAENFDADVSWDQETYTVSISTKAAPSDITVFTPNINPPVTSRGSTQSAVPNTEVTDSTSTAIFNANDLYWMSRIIQAEAGGEPFAGKVAVGEVILNRVKSTDFPNTIYEVIFDTKFGVQFTPVANGAIYNTPSVESIKAAETALSGSSYVDDALYFLNPRKAQSDWIIKNRDFCVSIANHDFYR